MLACHARRDLPAYYRINRAIHDRINRAASNGLLSQVYSTLNLRIQNLRFRSNFDQKKWDMAALNTAPWSMRSKPVTVRGSARSCAIICVRKGRRCWTAGGPSDW